MTMPRQWPIRLNQSARLFLDQLQKETGKRLTFEEDFADIYRLHVLGEEMEHPGSLEEEAALLDMPTTVAGVDFYRLRPGAWLWLKACNDWFDGDEEMMGLCILYAMAHGADRGLAKLNSKAHARAVIEGWAAGLRLGGDALERILDAYTPRGSSKAPGKQQEDPEGFGPVVALLVRETGLPVEHWLWAVNLDTLIDVLNEVYRMKFAETSDGKSENPFTPYFRAAREFHNFKLSLLEKHAPRKTD